MKRTLLAALLLTLILPVAATAAEPIELAEYQSALRLAGVLLRQAAALTEAPAAREWAAAARRLLQLGYDVQTPAGTAHADLTPLLRLLDQDGSDRQAFGEAAALVEAYLDAAEQLAAVAPLDVAAARPRLERALLEAESKGALARWLQQWWQRLFGRAAETAARTVGPGATWVAAIAGAIGVAVLAWGLARSLSGQSAGADPTWRGGRSLPGGRPPTPGERLARARELAAAGRFKPALAALQLALLEHLDALGLLHYDPALTNREHERQLRRRHPALATGLHGLHDRLELDLYSARATAAADFSAADQMVGDLWREGEAVSKTSVASTGPSS